MPIFILIDNRGRRQRPVNMGFFTQMRVMTHESKSNSR
jgi:hypothetical protein